MMTFQEAFSLLRQEKGTISTFKNLIATEFPDTLKAIKLIDFDNSKNKRRKGFNLVKVENKRYGHIYYVRYSHKGKMLSTKFNTHTSIIEEAEKFAFENKERLVEQYVRSHDVKTYTILEKFYEANSEYLLCEEKRNHKLSEKSRKDYHAFIIDRFVPFLRKKSVKSFNEITPHVLGDFQDFLLAEKMKPQTANNIYKAVRRIFKYLLRKGLIKENPCDHVRYIPVRHEDQKVRGCHEVVKLNGVFDRRWKDELSYLLCLIIYTTGMRNSEIMKATMSDIVKIGGSYFIDVKESKTPSGIRLVPLHSFVYKKISDHCSKKDTKEPIFGILSPSVFIKANKQLALKLKTNEEDLKKENITYYSGRHFWKTMMNAGGLGEDIEEIFMGHHVSGDVAKLYNHRDKQGKDRMVKKAKQVYKILDQYIFGKETKKTPA
jgi:integrase